DGCVVALHFLEEALRIHAVHLFGELLEGVRAHLRHLTDAIFLAEVRDDLVVENLPGHLVGLVQDDAAVLGVGVVAEVGAFVDESLAVGIDHDAPRVAVLLEIVADREVAEFGSVEVPADRVAARPVAVGAGADVEGHLDAVAGVVAGAAHLREVPAGAEIARPPLGVGLETTAGQHHGLGPDLEALAVLADVDAVDAVVIGDRRAAAGAVEDFDAFPARRPAQAAPEARTPAPGLDHEASPELELSLDLEGLLTVDRQELDALAPHPLHRVER